MARTLRLPGHAWVSIGWRTARHMLVAVIASVAISYLILATFSGGIGNIGLIAAIVAPLVLGGPMVLYMSLKHYELEQAYLKLEDAASRDSLTKCLHHGAFVDAVCSELAMSGQGGGALLVVDADHFKSINDRFGHASGDTALKLIVSAIRLSLEADDIVGRLGGEEFGIYLPGAKAERANRVADAIRLAVRTIEFDANGEICVLSVSIGGAVCSEPVTFNDIFRIADDRLYTVKKDGRNKTDIVVMPPRPANETLPTGTMTDLVYRGQKVRRA